MKEINKNKAKEKTMKRACNNLIAIVFALILSFTFSLASVGAETGVSTRDGLVTIRLGKSDKSGFTPYPDRSVQIWRIGDPISGDQTQVDSQLSSLLQDTQKKYPTVAKLKEAFGSPIEGRSDKDGYLTVKIAKNGSYYVREAASPDQDGYILPFAFVVYDYHNISDTVINSKVTYTRPNTGGARFLKVDSADRTKVLEGAKFRVTQKYRVIDKDHGEFIKTDDPSIKTYKPIMRGNKEYVVTSDKNGEFSVDGLDYGTYFLFELTPPTGYSQLAGPVKFEVGKDQSRSQVLAIDNRINPYDKGKTTQSGGQDGKQDGRQDASGKSSKKIVVPKTGDIMLFLLVVLGCVVASFGYLLTRDGSKRSRPLGYR